MTSETAPACSICDRLDRWRMGNNPSVICEFEHSLWIVGDHQYFPGYTLLLLKTHVRDLYELEPRVNRGYYDELMRATAAVVAVYAPWKMNYSNYGNLDPHLHWHLFPRRADEPKRTCPPLSFSDQFAECPTSPKEAVQIADALRNALADADRR